eukprot:926027-Karenia_brevis.AAC.1
MLAHIDARHDPRWQSLFSARPVRGVLARTAKRADVQLHPRNLWVNYKTRAEFCDTLRDMELWYKPGRKSTRARRR